MTDHARFAERRRPGLWRRFYWGGAAGLLLLPLVAMMAGAEGVDWSVGDFIFAALMFGTVGGLFELTMAKSGNHSYRGGVALALAASFLLIWINGAVGIIGSEDNPANLWFLGVVLLAVVGSALARFRPRGMAWAMGSAAAATAGIGAYVLATGLGASEPPGQPGVLLIIAVFAAMWLIAATLFRNAADDARGSG